MPRRRLSKDEWRSQIEEWRVSGQPREEWCAQRGLHARTMVWWERMLARGGRSTKPRQLQRPTFVEVTGAVANADDRIELEVAGIRVRLAATFDEGTLGRLLSLLEARR